MMNVNRIFSYALVCVVGLAVASSALAQDDVVHRIKSSGKIQKQKGTIENVGVLSVTLKGRSGPEEIPVWEIAKISASNEPAELEEARARIESGSYADALEVLDGIDTGFNPITDAEIDWNRALATAKMSFNGGAASAVDAAGVVRKFIVNNGKSYHYVPATALLGRLAMEAGNLDFAGKQFTTLTKSTWPEYVARGHFLIGEVQMRSKKYDEALAAYDKVIGLSGNDDATQQLKGLAQCQKAKAQAMKGDTQGAVAALEKIIKLENPDNKELFAYAYNALGACYLQAKDLAEAEEKFLFTHLLFDTEAAPHAEAVYQLADIWNTEKRTDLSSEARQILKSRYRNTWWSSQLN